MHVTTEVQLSKEEREAAINQRIEEIRKKNENITRRYQEIENDKKNAESFSQEATERMKTRVFPTENVNKITETKPASPTINENTRATKESRRTKQIVTPVVVTTDFRPQRLSENDLPPPDPVFSYLTDRLREGAFCAPISPAAHRKRSTSSQTSEMSIGSSRSSNSRKVSTASNSSWTSDTSSKYSGFSNYQPPRKYSACRDYVRNRRLSSEQMLSADERENDHQEIKSNYNYKDTKKSLYPKKARDLEIGKSQCSMESKAAMDSQISITSGNEITEVSARSRSSTSWKRESTSTNKIRSEYVTNWRERNHIQGQDVADFTVDLIVDGVEQLAVTSQDLNNNNPNTNNCNVLIH